MTSKKQIEVLWVEDQIYEVSTLVQSLTTAGHSVTFVGNRDRAIAMMNEGWRGDLLVLDSFMPDEEYQYDQSGCELYRELRSGRWGAWGENVAVLLVTGYEQFVRDQLAGLTPQPNAIVPKPVSLNKFGAIVGNLSGSVENISISIGDNPFTVQGDTILLESEDTAGVCNLLDELEKKDRTLARQANDILRPSGKELDSTFAAFERFRRWIESLDKVSRGIVETVKNGQNLSTVVLRGLGFGD